MKLIDLIGLPESHNLAYVDISNITNDSRHIVAGCLFLAEQGIQSHGLDYLTREQCEQATAIVYQSGYDMSRFSAHKEKMIGVENLNQFVSSIAKKFYNPQFAKTIIGITGTNGKTSVSQFISQFAHYGVIGTMGYGCDGNLSELSHTTPDSLSVQKILKGISQCCDGVAMEVSSHALSLHRVSSVPFNVAVFTNLSQDHLDFHESMEEYQAAKSILFNFDSVKVCIINTDDEAGYQIAQDCKLRGKNVIAYGRKSYVSEFNQFVKINEVTLFDAGIRCELQFNLENHCVAEVLEASIWGGFNVDNLLAAMLALYGSGYDIAELLSKTKAIKGVVGRIEPIHLGGGKVAIIDYSHTPDALDNVLLSLRAHTKNKIYAVFGCGGDRDKSKRPLMAEAVNRGADIGIITDDNPRTEKSADIIADVLKGNIDKDKFEVIASRKDAILYGLSQLKTGDVLLIAGKGHEDYQIIGTEKIHFSDHEVVHEWLAEYDL